MKLTPFLLTTTAALALAAVTAQAGLVTWGLPTNINPAGGAASDLDVSTAGSRVGAFILGDPGVAGTTVNTVPFQSFAVLLEILECDLLVEVRPHDRITRLGNARSNRPALCGERNSPYAKTLLGFFRSVELPRRIDELLLEGVLEISDVAF